MAEPETWPEQEDRLVMMGDEEDSKWDLSVNDRAAIRAALEKIHQLGAENQRLTNALQRTKE